MVIILLVHSLYALWIIPVSDGYVNFAYLNSTTIPRNFFVIVKDLEQEICLIISIWTAYLIIKNYLNIYLKRFIFEINLFENISSKKEGMNTLSEINNLDKNLRDNNLTKIVKNIVSAYLASGMDKKNLTNVLDNELKTLETKFESENSLIKYLIWAVPSIGFIGTVRGIGMAMSEADEAINGDITSMTNSLGIAFNSTFVALLLSILLMFLLFQLQKVQDETIFKIHDYVQDNFFLTLEEN